MPLLRRQLISKRAHGRKTNLESLDLKQVYRVQPIHTKQIEELFEHNKTVNPDSSEPAMQRQNVYEVPKRQLRYTEEDITHFKNIVLQQLCLGQTESVERMLGNAPAFSQSPGFTDARQYKFSMFRRDLGELREEKVCSPLAIAVCIGEPKLVDVVLTHMNEVELEFGLQTSIKTPAPLKTNLHQNSRRRTPLQYACSLGLF